MIIENDWLEAIIALPLNMFYNTGIATYIWVISNRKPAHRRGKVQLIDATQWYKSLRKNLGKKNCELSDKDIDQITNTFLAFEETEQSKIFQNQAFGYWKATVERPLRLRVDLTEAQRKTFRTACVDADEIALADWIDSIAARWNVDQFTDYNEFFARLEAEKDAPKLNAKRLKLLQTALAQRDEEAAPVIKRVYKPGKASPAPLYGRYETEINGKPHVVEYEPDSDLRDTEQVPLLEDGGIEAFIEREVYPYVPDAWVVEDATKIGYEISFTRYFYKPQLLRPLSEIRAEIEDLEKQTDGLLSQILNLGKATS